jgi:hypothetical protein
MLAHIAGLLLIYLEPGEVYCVLIELLKSSKEKMEDLEIKSMIRWHIPDDDPEEKKVPRHAHVTDRI